MVKFNLIFKKISISDIDDDWERQSGGVGEFNQMVDIFGKKVNIFILFFCGFVCRLVYDFYFKDLYLGSVKYVWF